MFKAVAVVGWLWPLAVAAAAVVAFVVLGDLRDRAFIALCVFGFVGTPAVMAGVYPLTPRGWPLPERLPLAAAGAGVIFAAELLLIMAGYMVGMLYWDLVPV